MLMRTNAVVLGVALAGCALSLHAQQAPAFRAAVEVVQLDVTVLDADRRPVQGLTGADFTVLEDGKPVTPVAFAAVELPPAPAAGTTSWLTTVPGDVRRNDAPIDRLVTIVLDDANTGQGGGAWDPWITRTGMNVARGFVDRLGPNDRAAVVFTFMGRSQNFTADRARLHAAIDSFAPKDSPTAGPPLGCQIRGAAVGCTIDTLQRVAESLPVAPPRRKIVVFISQGRGIPVFDFAATGAAAIDGSTPMVGALQRVFRAFQQANTTVYSFSPAGLSAGGAASDDALRVFAEQTGGRAVLATNAPAAQVGAVLDETSSYYLIGVPSAGADQRFRNITVRVNRPGLDVRTRSGYFPGAMPAADAPVVTPLEKAMIGGFPAMDLPLGTSAAAFRIPGRREALISVVSSVTSSAAGNAAAWQAEVAATAFDRDWRPRASHRQTIEVTARPGLAEQTVDALSAMELMPGRYELRVAADSAGRAGSVFVDLDVPEFVNAPLSASGVVISTVQQPYAPSPLLAALLPVTPSSRRAFARNEPAELFLRFYQGGRGRMNAVSVSMSIADTTGARLVQGTETIAENQFTAARSSDWRFMLPVGRLAPGEYLFTIDASLDEHRVQRQLRFRITE
jgi:VWFA-related protein